MENHTPTICLSIAGSDPCAGAGIQLDSRVFTALGCYPTAVPALLTTQNTTGVIETLAVSSSVLCQQLEFLLSDIQPMAAKVSAVGTKTSLAAALNILSEQNIPIVLDPVLHSSSGRRLLDIEAKEFFEVVENKVKIITPNIPEAEFLLSSKIASVADMQDAAIELSSKLCSAVLLTGGHLDHSNINDVLAHETETVLFSSQKIPEANNIHGSGCTLSAALTCSIAKGKPLEQACREAIAWCHDVFRQSVKIGSGKLVVGLTT